MYIDTHCHLNFPELYKNRKAVVERAVTAGVGKIITIGTDIESSVKSIEIAKEFPEVFAAAGVHPTDLLNVTDNWQNELLDLLKHSKVVALGEIGLDYYWETTKPEDQRRFFSEQIQIAKSIKLPMIIHNRQADDDIKSILLKQNYFNGVLHCYSSDDNFALEMIELGLQLSFTGNITYGSKKLQRVLQAVPLERIMLETDAPFITPVPHKGKINEPAYIPLIAQNIAKLKELSIETVANTTTQTALGFFNINS
ncbi:TatD family hydrolase [bacterium]|nr:TatD family hydrolase [bacterium]MBU1065258.1 TatD family hydrolase [bacterium]MBU1633571.1 TatD family hydrolase [bacterium]MBU1872390.1 TatD family hydrolase [bacterium]